MSMHYIVHIGYILHVVVAVVVVLYLNHLSLTKNDEKGEKKKEKQNRIYVQKKIKEQNLNSGHIFVTKTRYI